MSRVVGKVNDPLRVRLFFGRTLGMPSMGGGGIVAFPGGDVDLLGGLGGPMLRGAPAALPKSVVFIAS